MSKRTVFAAILAATLALGGGALAQTSQPSAAQPPTTHQGGYLGTSPGTGAMENTGMSSEADMMKSATAWCWRNSDVPGRCITRADSDHEYCLARAANDVYQYYRCRKLMDQFGWRP